MLHGMSTNYLQTAAGKRNLPIVRESVLLNIV